MQSKAHVLTHHLCSLYASEPMRTFEVVFRLGVVRAHDGGGLAPDHDEHPHPGLGLLLQQLPEGEAARVQLRLTLQKSPVVAPESRRVMYDVRTGWETKTKIVIKSGDLQQEGGFIYLKHFANVATASPFTIKEIRFSGPVTA